MRIVIDANIVLSSLVAGRLTDILLSPKFELFAPDLLFTEIQNNTAEIKAKSRLSEAEFGTLLRLLEKRVRLVPFEGFAQRFEEAEQALQGHKKDAPYVALALQLGCPVWTYEKRFEGNVQTMKTADVRRALREVE